MDPVYGQSRVDKELTVSEQSELLLRVNSDAERAIAALRFESAGYQTHAIDKWKEIFLGGFPK
jgi:hypothetical protein